MRVNHWVNANIRPMTDLKHWGVAERWNYPDDGYGDCEDYVLEKRRMLMAAGWPREALLITVVHDQDDDGHAVLTVATDKVEFILDNARDDMIGWLLTAEVEGYRLTRTDILDILGRLRGQGRTVFVNSHALSELESICDRVAILVKGRVAKQGTLDELTVARQRYEIDVATEDPLNGRQRVRAAVPAVWKESVEVPAAAPFPAGPSSGRRASSPPAHRRRQAAARPDSWRAHRG